MKNILKYIAILSLILTFSCDPTEEEKQAKKIKKASIESLYEAIDKIDWNDREALPAGNPEANQPCFTDLMNKIDNLPDPELEKMDAEDIYVTYRFSIALKKFLKKHKLYDIEGANIDILPNNARDRIIRKLDRGYGNDEFESEVKGDNGHLTDDESTALKEFYELYNDTITKKGRFLFQELKRVGNCLVSEHLAVNFKGVRRDQASLEYTVTRTLLFYCECESGQETNVRTAKVVLESTILGSFEQGGLFNLVFSDPSKPRFTRLELICCE